MPFKIYLCLVTFLQIFSLYPKGWDPRCYSGNTTPSWPATQEWLLLLPWSNSISGGPRCLLMSRSLWQHAWFAPRTSPLIRHCLGPIPHRPWSHIFLDIVTGLPPSAGNTVVMTIVEHFSKMDDFIPLAKLPSAKQTPEVTIIHVYRTHSLPFDIVSDMGPQFVTCFWKEFCCLLGGAVNLSGFYI